MEFDKSRVYTALNADELKVGSKIIVGDNLSELKECVLKHRLPKIIKKIEEEDCEHRFMCDDDFHYTLAYLVSEPEEKKLKWTDLKIGDVLKNKKEHKTAMVVQIDEDCTDLHILAGSKWLNDDDFEEWEKVEE